jgi:glutamate transport system substrate-binding protein
MRASRKLLSLALVAGLSLATAACGDDDTGSGSGSGSPSGSGDFKAGSTMERLNKAGKVKVGIKFDQPLFGLKNPTSGQVEGFDAEIAKIIADELGLGEDDIEFVEAISKNREPFIQAGTVDYVVATYTINDKRKGLVGFAGPYYIAGQDIMVKANDTAITGVDSLAGKRVCSVTGSTSEKNIKEKAPQAKVTLFDTYTKCAEALDNRQVDAVSTDNVILLGLIDKFGSDKFKLVGNTFTSEPYGIGVKKGDDDFRNFINDVLEKAYQDGRWKAAFEKTVGKVEKTVPTPPAVDRYTDNFTPVPETSSPIPTPTAS